MPNPNLDPSDEMKNKKLIISWNKVKYFIDYKNITYIERLDRVTYIHAGDHKKYKTSLSLDLLEKQLPANFIRTHKSYFVNADFIKVFKNNEILLENEIALPISRSRSKSVKDILYQLLEEK